MYEVFREYIAPMYFIKYVFINGAEFWGVIRIVNNCWLEVS